VSAHPQLRDDADLFGYRIEGLVGRGGMGVVYRAVDLRLKRTVALKLMAPELALDEGFRERFSRESELAMALEHPNVVPIHDAGEADGRLYLAMRYVDGSDLSTLLRAEGALDPARAVTIARQVAGALDAAHARGLVHRDVKPSNVLLDPGEHVYLADFGLTRGFAEQGGQAGDTRSLGTPAYLAPEQIEGGPVDGRADVYSLGCLLYECLTGEAPFSRDSRLGVVWAHLEEEPPRASERNPALPSAVDPVIQRAMAKEREARHASCTELVGAAEEALGLRRPAGHRRRGLLLLAAAIVAVLAALAAVLAPRGDGETAGSGLTVRENTIVRYDPRTNEIMAVIDVGRAPVATVVNQNTVWVYNLVDRSVSEVDSATNEVRHSTPVSTVPGDINPAAGTMLAADPGGAWLIGSAEKGYPASGPHLLTRVPLGGGELREYRLDSAPAAVAVGEGAVWVLLAGAKGHAAEVLRIDPRTGEVTGRTPLSFYTPAGGLDVGEGAVFVMDGEKARLYRIDVRSGGIRKRDVGDFATPPLVAFGSLWICVADPGSSMLRLNPRTLRNTMAINTIPAEGGRFAVGYGALWRHDVPTGAVIRFDSRTGRVAGTIRVTPPPNAMFEVEHLTPTAVAAGAGGIWVAVAKILL
jgi:DNA-binding beta-propeller fold protein YncE